MLKEETTHQFNAIIAILILVIRRWSNRVSLAYKLVPTAYLFWLLSVGHRLIFYSISTGTCVGLPGIYTRYDKLFETIMSGLCPPTILCILGILLIRSIRNVMHRQVAPTVDTIDNMYFNRPVLNQIDTQISFMLLMQTLVAIPSFLPYGGELLYTNLSQDWYKTPIRRAWEAVMIETIHLLSYLFFGVRYGTSYTDY